MMRSHTRRLPAGFFMMGILATGLLLGACAKETVTPKTASDEKKAGAPKAPQAAGVAKQVELQTTHGNIVIELDADKAPKSVANFTQYVRDGFYDGTIFHRVIRTFMAQGGGFTTDHKKKPTRAAIQNEADNGLKNLRGTVAMARTSFPHSATAQFFINVVDNAFLDHREKTPRGWGYTVFGKVITGMDVVDKIRDAPVENKGGPFSNLPQTPIVINKARVLN